LISQFNKFKDASFSSQCDLISQINKFKDAALTL